MSPSSERLRSGLVGFRLGDRAVCVDCDVFPPGWIEVREGDAALLDECDVCGQMLREVLPVSSLRASGDRDLEIQTGMTNKRAFMALLMARLQPTLDEMVEFLRAPTFPVHDEPSGDVRVRATGELTTEEEQ